jgi:hypothetical protein
MSNFVNDGAQPNFIDKNGCANVHKLTSFKGSLFKPGREYVIVHLSVHFPGTKILYKQLSFKDQKKKHMSLLNYTSMKMTNFKVTEIITILSAHEYIFLFMWQCCLEVNASN